MEKEVTTLDQQQPAVQYRFNVEDDYFSPLDDPIVLETPSKEEQSTTQEVKEEATQVKSENEPVSTAEQPLVDDTPVSTTEEVSSAVMGNTEESAEEPAEKPSEEPAEKTNVEQQVTDDFYKAKAYEMVQRGELPEDFDLDQELNAGTIFSAWEENVKPQVYQSLQNQFLQELNSAGYTAEHLQMAKMLYNNADYNELADALDYKDLSEKDLSSFDDEDKVEYIKLAYQDRGLEDFAISKMIDSAEVDGDIDKLVETSQKHYKDRYSQVYQSEMQKAAQEEQNRKQLELQKLNTLNTILQNREINGEKLSDSQLITFRDSLTKATVPIDHNGQRYNFTPFQVFQEALKNNYELQLYTFKKYLFKDQEGQAMIKEMQKKAEDEALMAWGEVRTVKKDKDKPKDKKESTNQSSEVFKFNSDDGFELYEKKS